MIHWLDQTVRADLQMHPHICSWLSVKALHIRIITPWSGLTPIRSYCKDYSWFHLQKTKADDTRCLIDARVPSFNGEKRDLTLYCTTYFSNFSAQRAASEAYPYYLFIYLFARHNQKINLTACQISIISVSTTHYLRNG